MRAYREAKTIINYLRNWVYLVPRLVVNKPLVWVAQDGSDEEMVEHWPRKEMFQLLRPRYYGLKKELPCGCSRRFGKIILYRWKCEEHSRLRSSVD